MILEEIMNFREYGEMERRERNYWWHVGRLRIIEKECRRQTKSKRAPLKILNIGCGTGGTIRMLEQFGTVYNVDVSDEALRLMKKNGFKNLYKVDGIDLPFEKNSFDLVAAFDVLEHIEDDQAALKEWYRVLKRGGKVMITVPAYSWLWSGHDVSLHHFRRYTTGRLREKLKNAKFSINKATYAIAFSLPLVAGFRLLHKMRGAAMDSETSYVDLRAPVNTLFTKMLFAEASLHGITRLPAGTSVMTVGEKK